MKKLFFGLIATVMLGFVGQAQEKVYADVKKFVDLEMVVLVQAAKPTYVKGMNFSEWTKQYGPYSPTKEETLLMQKVFGYLSNSTSDADILKQDNSVLFNVAKSTISDSPDSQNRFCLKCILQALKEIIEVIISHLP